MNVLKKVIKKFMAIVHETVKLNGRRLAITDDKSKRRYMERIRHEGHFDRKGRGVIR